jgi:hypothetical protein
MQVELEPDRAEDSQPGNDRDGIINDKIINKKCFFSIISPRLRKKLFSELSRRNKNKTRK